MLDKECVACHGIGMQADDEGWQYKCSVCEGTGIQIESSETKVLEADKNNRLLD